MIYHLEVSKISKKDNRSIIGAYAYATRENAKSELYNKRFNYTRLARTREDLIHKTSFLNGKHFLGDIKKILCKLEVENDIKAKKFAKKEAYFGYRIIVALPKELNDNQNKDLVNSFCKKISEKGLLAIGCIHKPKESDNVHCHIIMTANEIDMNGKILKKSKWVKNIKFIRELRIMWQDHLNETAKQVGLNKKVSCKKKLTKNRIEIYLLKQKQENSINLKQTKEEKNINLKQIKETEKITKDMKKIIEIQKKSSPKIEKEFFRINLTRVQTRLKNLKETMKIEFEIFKNVINSIKKMISLRKTDLRRMIEF